MVKVVMMEMNYQFSTCEMRDDNSHTATVQPTIFQTSSSASRIALRTLLDLTILAIYSLTLLRLHLFRLIPVLHFANYQQNTTN